MRILSTLARCAAVLALVAAAPAFAQEKEAPPAGGTPKNFTLPKIESYTLKNGVKVTLVPYGRVPKATVRAVMRVGNLNDGELPYVADLTADMLQEGAGGQSAADLARAAADMGGDLNIGVGLDQTFVVMDVLAESAPDAVGMIADVLRRPTMPESEFDKVKQNQLRNLSIGATQPGQMANDAFSRIMYPDHPYGESVLPDPAKVGALTLDDIKAFHAANFGGARAEIYVVGQFDSKKVKQAISKAFGKWEKGPAPLKLPVGAEAGPAVKLVDRPGAVQSTIRLGKRVPPLDGSLQLEAADTILGGYFSSRITRNIREDKGYTYSPGSFVNTQYKAANWQQNADITSEATGPALAEIIKEVRRLQDETPSAAEVDGVKNYMNGIFVIQLASRGGMANQLSFVNLHELGLSYLESFVGKAQALTPADFQNAAKQHLQIDEMSLVVVGDLASVRPQLEALPDFKDKLPAK